MLPLAGTNTYLVGHKNPYTLIDTGEGKAEYISVLASALRDAAQANPNEPDVSDIILSHKHGDHVGGLPSVLGLLKKLWEERNLTLVGNKSSYRPPRIHKFPLPSDAPDAVLQHILDSLPSDLYTPNAAGNPLHDLSDSQIFPLTNLRVLHTPGHTPDSIALYLPSDRALYTADTVLGQGTAVFEDLTDLISSLRKILEFGKTEGGKYTRLYPGHGPVVDDGASLIETYISHRLEREEQIVGTLKTPPPVVASGFGGGEAGLWTTWTLVTTIYAKYPESLWLPAAHSVDLHLKKLERDGKVKRVGGEGKDTQWAFV